MRGLYGSGNIQMLMFNDWNEVLQLCFRMNYIKNRFR